MSSFEVEIAKFPRVARFEVTREIWTKQAKIRKFSHNFLRSRKLIPVKRNFDPTGKKYVSQG